MVRYLQYLLLDISHAGQHAPSLASAADSTAFIEEDALDLHASKKVNLEALLGIPAISFPPATMLTDAQIIRLVEAIGMLWEQWRLRHYLPDQLSDRQIYGALTHAMSNVEVDWNPFFGGEVKICQYSQGEYCPFGPNASNCHCKAQAEAARLDVENWEEHVRSQGLDPYFELSAEEEAAFEEEMQLRHLKKQIGDDSENFAPFEEAWDNRNDAWPILEPEPEKETMEIDWFERLGEADERNQLTQIGLKYDTSDDFDTDLFWDDFLEDDDSDSLSH